MIGGVALLCCICCCLRRRAIITRVNTWRGVGVPGAAGVAGATVVQNQVGYYNPSAPYTNQYLPQGFAPSQYQSPQMQANTYLPTPQGQPYDQQPFPQQPFPQHPYGQQAYGQQPFSQQPYG